MTTETTETSDVRKHECGITISVVLDGEHLVNECFTGYSSEADDALAHAVHAFQTAQATCEQRAEDEWEAMMNRKHESSASELGK